MAKRKLGVEGFGGVQRRSDRLYSHAVVAVPDVVRQAEHRLAWEKSPERQSDARYRDSWDRKVACAGDGGIFRPDNWKFDYRVMPGEAKAARERLAKWPNAVERFKAAVAKAEAELAAAKARVAAGEVKPEVISFHASAELAAKAMRVKEIGSFLKDMEIRPVFEIPSKRS